MTTETAGASVHFTLDGTDPTEASTIYEGPFSVATGLTVKAKAFRQDWTPSQTTAVALAFNYGTLAAPTATPGSGTYAPSQSITLSGPPGAVIAYTWDGSDPSVNSFVYNTPLTLPEGASALKARAFRTDWTPSPTSRRGATLRRRTRRRRRSRRQCRRSRMPTGGTQATSP